MSRVSPQCPHATPLHCSIYGNALLRQEPDDDEDEEEEDDEDEIDDDQYDDGDGYSE